jgi:hypothetical protein
MSFSFHVRAATKAEALAAAKAEMDKVVQSQPLHEIDQDHVLKVVEMQSEFVTDADDRDFYFNVNGSIGQMDGNTSHASVGVTAGLLARPAAE